ncbi:hypothetical protein JX265_013938 [Neoarthrinium moseri]|uniref:Transposase n=1 Tax=Neoarthrinium moseri TaxID=1658444 RepID=A0A9P9W7M0_9PEZI|nr:hypothetical protein JX265_013938 [Neoarthrinium moseri]
MAPQLAQSQLEKIESMLSGDSLKDSQRAQMAECNERAIRRIRSRLRRFGSTRKPIAKTGRPRSVTAAMLQPLRAELIDEPVLYLDEMTSFIESQFDAMVTVSSMSRALASIRWTKKKTRRVAQEQNADLRDFYFYDISQYRSYHLVFIDESGLNTIGGIRRNGWSPSGVAPVHTAAFHRGPRHRIIGAYTQDGILYYDLFEGTTNHTVYKEFIEQVVQHCGRWPEPKSVLVMDNVPFHRVDRIKEICESAGVLLKFLSPYSPDLNPIEEYFGRLKVFARRHWRPLAKLPYIDFGSFVEWCIQMVGAKKDNARGHFRHSGIYIEEPPSA